MGDIHEKRLVMSGYRSGSAAAINTCCPSIPDFPDFGLIESRKSVNSFNKVNSGNLARTPPSSVQRRAVALLCGLVAVCDGFDTQAIAFVAPVISRQWGVPANQFGPVFSAGLVGLAIGAFLLGSAADRIGRKNVILFCVGLFGVASILTTSSSSMTELAAWRVLTGLGLGGVLPNLVALTNEFAEDRYKNSLVMIMFCGFPVGATIGGIVSAPLIGAAGWTSVFVFGGVLPLCLLPFLLRVLPANDRRGWVDAASDSSVFPPPTRLGITGLFAEKRASATLLIWAAFFSNLLVMYLLVNWLPSLLSLAGSSLSVATLSTAVLNLGGVGGALLLSRIVNGPHAFTVLALSYLVGTVALVLIARADGNLAIILLGAAFAGATVVGGQIAMNAVTASFYPSEIRSTGVGWALGVGRIGSIAGPLLGGALMKAGWQGTSPVLFGIFPMLVAGAALFGLRRYLHDGARMAP